MRRLLNFSLLLVLLGSVGYLLHKAKLLPFGRSTPPPAPTMTAAPARDTLRISVAHRPEALLVNALKRLLEAENRRIEVVPFNPETSWMELAAGELDLLIAPIGEAVTAQARFQAGRFLFISGMSEGYDLVLAKAALSGPPKTLGISGGPGGELFAIAKFPDSLLVNATDQRQLQTWLREGAVQAAVLESAGLSGELAQTGKKLGATSAESPVPSVVVISRTLVEENAGTEERIEILLKTLQSWSGLIDYLTTQPELLRSTLKQETEEMGVELDVLLRDYRFLTPNAGRDILLNSQEDGLLKEIFDLLVLARTVNLTAPGDWNEVLALPPYLETVLPGGSGPVELATPTPGQVSPTPAATPEATPQAAVGFPGTHTFAGTAPPDPWPETLKMKKVSTAAAFPPALTGDLVGLATSKGFEAFGADGKPAFAFQEGGAPLARPLAGSGYFYIVQAGLLNALDSKGKIAWTFPFEGTPGPDPVLTPTEVVFTLDSSSVYQVMAVSRETGRITWQAALSHPPASGPVFADAPQASILVLDDQGTLNAWNAQTGSVLWQSSAVGTPTFLAPAVLGDAMAIMEPNGGVRLLSLADGSQQWEIDLGTPLAGTPTVTESLVLVPAKDTYLYALDRANGAIKGKTRLSVPLSAAAVVVDDHVYCSDELGGVHSLTLPALTLNWSKSLAKGTVMGPVFSEDYWSMLASDGTLLMYPR